ncbi:MAG: low molecular weight phosphotyrosine protein phosphatase [Pseudomonadales bacterium]|nr:low molecular weight phosphotyrosine protein phosphatase [Pseudomonadales bacterium]
MRVLLVCLGNICRSPTAEVVFRSGIDKAGLNSCVDIVSCGTAGYHIGESPDSRSQAAAKDRGYDMSALRGRQIQNDDFECFDFILAMDESNLCELKQRCPKQYVTKLELFLTYAGNYQETEVPDPYYGGQQGFSHVLDLVEDASKGLVEVIKARL